MTAQEPVDELQTQFSSGGAVPTKWVHAAEHLEKAEIYWLSTVRPDGRPHVAPLISVWLDGALHFCTGPGERKARNLAGNAHCVLMTGNNSMKEALDVMVEGTAVRVTDDALLRRLADAYAAKYGWRFDVRDGAFCGDGGEAHVFAVAPAKVLGFRRGKEYSATRWRF